MGWTPCMVQDESKPIGEQFSCPYGNESSSDRCAQCEWEHNERKTEEEAADYYG